MKFVAAMMAALALSAPAFAQDSAKLAAVTRGLEARVAAGDIAGAVALAARDGKPFYSAAVGQRDLATGAPMTADSLFRIYSMTRPMTSVAILMLADEGKLSVYDPVSKYLPKFADQRVLTEPDGDGSQTKPRRGDITIGQLMTHTSGIGERSSKLYVGRRARAWDMTAAQVADNYAAAPLFENPAQTFRYGESAEVLGRVVEVVSGMPLDRFLQRRLFKPLGMTDTVFFVDPKRAARLAPVYRKGADGKLGEVEMEPIPVTQRRALISGGVGLVSSASDLMKFGQFVLDKGVVKGKPLLSGRAAIMLYEDAIPPALKPIGASGFYAGSGWTRGGFAIVDDPSKYNHTVSKGEIWWDGSAGTRFWIDPSQGVVAVILAQVQPASGGSFREAFKTGLYEAIDRR